ncbi:CoA transferase [Sphingomonas sp. CL5.1]|uniref:CaiB/BaiF CoA transferase family protein n=1 Tax=Sphingomonas sp. CL5.1 TaxID=2653203 RepID=UPI001584390E|nr:CoA transferase [Sphingomonas sp. CL5.1]QKS00581.1 CoA transferase [Sphingomonas sp. CL5.1]
MSAILESVRILDFGRYIAGPFCAGLLADIGAEVIRIERPGGGDDRYLMPATRDGEGAMFLQSNRGKKSLTLDIGAPAARPVLERLIASADIVIANFSTGALRHFGMDYDALKAIRPDIILTTVGAFDARSDMAEAVGFDGVGQAISGAIYLTGEPDRPYRSATSYVDYSTAISAAFGTLAALIRRMRTGEGGLVEATLAGTALNIMNPVLMEQEAGANVRAPIANRSPIAGPSDMFRARDGWFVMQVIGQGMFRRWTKMIGRADLLDDPRFANDIQRGRNGAELSTIMAEWAADRGRDECLATIASFNIGASPVLTPADVIGGAMGLHDTYFRKVDYPGTDGVSLARPLASIGPDAAEMPRRPPLLGEHSDELLAGLGLDRAEIAALRGAGVV